MVETGVVLLKPPPSPPSTTSPSTPASTAFCAARSDGTTWNTVIPASCNSAVYRSGLPAEVVTKVTPCPATNSMMSGSATNIWAMLTPQGWPVRSRMAAISRRTSSSRPEDVSTMPKAPAFETAEASWARAMNPMGACSNGVVDTEEVGDAGA